MQLPLTLDSQSGIPLHRQLYDEIRRSILSRRLAPGQRVPSSRALADSLGISRATVTLSYDYLLSEGYLEALTGSGTYVCRQLPDELLKAQTPAKKEKQSGQQTPRATNYKKLARYGVYLRDKPWLSYGGLEPEVQFAFGRPALKEFPMRQWLQLYNARCRQASLSELDCPSQSKGYRPLRESLAKYLGRARALRCEPEQIIIVNGSQQAIDLVSRVIIDRGDPVGIENPGYIGAKKAFEVQGAQLVPLPVDQAGLIVDRLKEPQNNVLKLLYVTPSHQSPTGVVLSLPRRLELLAWAERTGTFIIEDDYDSEYRYEGRPIPALAGLEHNDTVIYIGTFSKVLLPALRIGYLVVPPALADVFARAKFLADRHSPLIEQQVLCDFINQGYLDRHIRRMRALYAERRKAVIATLRELFGERISILGDNAGINVLVRLHDAKNDQEIVERARQLDVGLVSTAGFYLDACPHGEFLLNYGGLTEEEIRTGLGRFYKAAFDN